ncbi:unnamed protein product [Mytilus edulis]|uniref:Uncharacterized protein n=1 Tax=Mytilus edulis TaxID=6550 RepID=A0A8S3RF10_MYTED|nr:unnamed protein product [Mytilus edulis]
MPEAWFFFCTGTFHYPEGQAFAEDARSLVLLLHRYVPLPRRTSFCRRCQKLGSSSAQVRSTTPKDKLLQKMPEAWFFFWTGTFHYPEGQAFAEDARSLVLLLTGTFHYPVGQAFAEDARSLVLLLDMYVPLPRRTRFCRGCQKLGSSSGHVRSTTPKEKLCRRYQN